MWLPLVMCHISSCVSAQCQHEASPGDVVVVVDDKTRAAFGLRVLESIQPHGTEIRGLIAVASLVAIQL